jgi:hypothetical protein
VKSPSFWCNWYFRSPLRPVFLLNNLYLFPLIDRTGAHFGTFRPTDSLALSLVSHKLLSDEEIFWLSLFVGVGNTLRRTS